MMYLQFDFSAAFTDEEFRAIPFDFFNPIKILINERKRITGHYNVLSLEIDGDLVDIVLPNLERHGLSLLKGMESKSAGSQAIYPMKIPLIPIGLAGGLLLQILPPQSETSFHRHRDTDEIFCYVAGACWVKTGATTAICLSEIKYLEVKAQTPHCLYTDTDFAITLIRKIGGHYLDCSHDYIYEGGGQGTPHIMCNLCQSSIPAC